MEELLKERDLLKTALLSVLDNGSSKNDIYNGLIKAISISDNDLDAIIFKHCSGESSKSRDDVYDDIMNEIRSIMVDNVKIYSQVTISLLLPSSLYP